MRSSEWHPEARELRASGMKVSDIAEKLGRKRSAVSSAVRGVKCSVDHNRTYYDRGSAPPVWRDEARRLRREYMPVKRIAAFLGVRHEAVSREVADIPVTLSRSHRSGVRVSPESIAKRVATFKANHVPKPKTKRVRVYEPRNHVTPPAELRRRKIHNVIARDQRAPASITLPRLKFLEDVE